MTGPSPRSIARALGPWFEREQRDLSWRRTRDPYAIWVSEIMLQQTRVDTVERYFEPFLRAFPTVQSLASADVDSVLARWSGLGYYRRARLLHRGAQHVCQAHDGRVPPDPDALRAIPGVGRYTAGAIASIAFDRPEPLVDGNVARVLSRLRAHENPADQDARAEHHWDEVRRILSHGEPRVLAQALMELGATVCTPVAPRCQECPVRSGCEARRRGLVDVIPAPRKKVAQPESRWIGLVVQWRGKVLLTRRPDDGLLGGMWCVPLLSTKSSSPSRAPRKQMQDLLGVDVELSRRPRRPIKHVFTHRIWHVHPWAGEARARPVIDGDVAWVAPGETPAGGVPTLTRKILGTR